MREIKIQFVVSENDPMITIESGDVIRYTHIGKVGRMANCHGLQCDFVESENPERYKKIMSLCDTIANASRELYELNKVKV